MDNTRARRGLTSLLWVMFLGRGLGLAQLTGAALDWDSLSKNNPTVFTGRERRPR